MVKGLIILLSLILMSCSHDKPNLVEKFSLDDKGNHIELMRISGGGAAGFLYYQLWQVSADDERSLLMNISHTNCLSISFNGDNRGEVNLYYSAHSKINKFNNFIYFRKSNMGYEIILHRVEKHCPGINVLRRQNSNVSK